MDSTNTLEGCFQLMGGDFTDAGAASSELKSALTGIGVPQAIVRRAAIAAFEAEMNIIIHAVAGTLHYEVTSGRIHLHLADMGPGIPDLELAMKEGYSTAPDWVREMGWGAGMGLPNIKHNADEFKLDSVMGEGTNLDIVIYIKEKGDAAS
jgi:anti-sigma regulatory factor (Ser/Thr protein kinase)